MRWNKAHVTSLAALLLASQAWAQQVGPLPDIPKGTLAIQLQPVATGLGAPDYAFSPPGDVNRLFVIEQKGLLLVIQNGALLPTPALDIQSRVAPPLNPANANDERGFLGLAFHPGFNTPGSPGFGTLYTYHSELIATGTTTTYPTPNANPASPAPQTYKNVIAEWKISAGDPNQVDPASRRELISFGKNAGNHNGGTLAFGPDGYMYLALGDGGNANDVGPSHIEPGGNAQNLSTPLGKFLRIDPLLPSLNPGSPDPVSSNGQYRIPLTNPFQGPGQVPEIFAYGVRNPYRYSFDNLTGELIHADVGQNNVEEIDRIVLGGNYGWAVKEGDFLFDRATGNIGLRSPGSPAGLTDPLSGPLGTLEYDHSDGISITGGFVYRGTAIPELYGKYVFGDLALRNAPPRVDGRMFYADLASGEMLEFQLPQFPADKLPNGLTVHGFGEDASGELYALVTNTPANGSGGIVYRLAHAGDCLIAGPDSICTGMTGEFHVTSNTGAASVRWSVSGNAVIQDTTRIDTVVVLTSEPGSFTLSVSVSDSALAAYCVRQVAVGSCATPALLSVFEGRPLARGIELQWEFADPARFASTRLERAGESAGPWIGVDSALRIDGGRMTAVDASAEAGRSYYYRLNATGTDGSVTLFGPLRVTAGPSTAEFALSQATPNPTTGITHFDFSLAREATVSVTLVDVSGREVSTLASGHYRAGHYQASWNGELNGSKAPLGLYFIRYRTPAGTLVRRLTLVR